MTGEEHLLELLKSVDAEESAVIDYSDPRRIQYRKSREGLIPSIEIGTTSCETVTFYFYPSGRLMEIKS